MKQSKDKSKGKNNPVEREIRVFLLLENERSHSNIQEEPTHQKKEKNKKDELLPDNGPQKNKRDVRSLTLTSREMSEGLIGEHSRFSHIHSWTL